LSHWYYPASPHRRFWNWVEYIFFFYNAIVGIVASIFRILLSIGVNLLLLFRLDTVIFMKGWEFLDAGHKAFNGFLYLEYTYNNAVMNMFVKLMTDVVSTEGGRGSAYDQEKAASNEEPLTQMRNKQARNRWLLAYTLLRNPSLQELTASMIEEKKPQEVVATGVTDPGLEAESSDIKQPLWSTVKEGSKL